ncbi:EAL domain-containing protein [Ectothiorhodospiraceae bacterium WFHF3C12]|nr:EAL domain-containing protein [Ectothiorhodospiraceae bacterium WFHF3C12]
MSKNAVGGGWTADAASVTLFFVPVLHPLLIPLVGVPSHLLWWVHVFPVAVSAYRYGRAGAVLAVLLSAMAVMVGERLFGAGYGIPANWETAIALTTALTATNLLVAGFALSTGWAARRLHDLAYRDELTSLHNRRHLEEVLADSGSSAGFAILFLDLDDLKTVNDSLGHAAGDAVLVAFSDRLRGCVQPEDTVARWAGDEFVVLIGGVSDASGATAVAERIQDALARPVMVSGVEVTISANIGIALGEAGGDFERLLREADTALYRAKEGGTGAYRLFDHQMHAEARRRLTIVNGLRRAIENGELVNYYQPIFDAQNGGIRGAEALVRWRHPEQGMIPPGDFIPLAEASGLIVDIGRAVLAQALRDLQHWQAEDLLPEGFYLTINVSAVELQQKSFVEHFTDACRQVGVDTGRLVIEITETAVMATERPAVMPLHRLKENGLRLAIDDFGSGYSSLRYLHRMPVDILKIDRELVQQIDEDQTSIVQPIVDFASALGLDVIAEGIETETQIARLRALGVTGLQGFALGRPGPAGDLFGLAPAEERGPQLASRR